MFGRQIRKAAFLLCGLFVIGNVGCSSIWREKPLPVTPSSKLKLDASWFAESPTEELIGRVARDRQRHMEDVISKRNGGAVGVSLFDATLGNKEVRHSVSEEIPSLGPVRIVKEEVPVVSTERTDSGTLMINLEGEIRNVR